jgi:hypothetical protein
MYCSRDLKYEKLLDSLDNKTVLTFISVAVYIYCVFTKHGGNNRKPIQVERSNMLNQ